MPMEEGGNVYRRMAKTSHCDSAEDRIGTAKKVVFLLAGVILMQHQQRRLCDGKGHARLWQRRSDYGHGRQKQPRRGELPQPNVEFVSAGTPSSAMTKASMKGILINPLNAGAGPFPTIVSDAQWVAACKKLLEQESSEQFLVNLLFMLRQSFQILAD